MTDRYNELISAAKAIPIETEVARRGIKLLRVGAEMVGPCPICGGDDRFAVNRVKQVWNCRGCAKGGDVIDLVRHLDASNFIDACRTLTGIPPPPRPNGDSAHKTTASKHSAPQQAALTEVVVATYLYHDADGTVLYRKQRVNLRNSDGSLVLDKRGKPQKTFRLQRSDGRGGWINNLDSVKRVMYRLPRLIEAVANDQVVFIVEGEQKVDRLGEISIVATCGPDGSSRWRDEFSEPFRGADVVVVPDNDSPGRAYAEKIVAALQGVAHRLRIFDIATYWRECPAGGDVVDLMEAGGVDEIWEVAERIPTAENWLKSRAANAADKSSEQRRQQGTKTSDLICLASSWRSNHQHRLAGRRQIAAAMRHCRPRIDRNALVRRLAVSLR
jgi:DNA primase